MRPPRFALVGSSGFAANLAAPALSSSHAELTGVLGSSPERGEALAERLGVHGYASLPELLADERVEAVWVAAHDLWHEPIGVACLQAGKHVLMEKPIAPSLSAAQTLISAADQAGLVLRVGTHQRFRPVYRALRELIASGALGTIGFLRLQFMWEFSADRVIDNWRATLAGSGGAWVVKEFGAHLLDLLLWWTGRGAVVTGAVLETRRFPVETDDCAAILLRLASGGIGFVEVSAAMSGRSDAVEIHGTEGWARATGVWRGTGRVERSDGESVIYDDADPLQPYYAQLDDFASALAGGPSSGADGQAGLAALELVQNAIAAGAAFARPLGEERHGNG